MKFSQDDLWSIHQRLKLLLPLGISLSGVALLLAVNLFFVLPTRVYVSAAKPPAQPVQIEDLKMITPTDGWALLKDRTGVLVTHRGSTQWQKVTPPDLYLPPNNLLNSITSWFVLDERHAYIGVLQNGLTSLWRTENGGRSWTEAKFDFQPLTNIGIYQIEFIDVRHGWLAFDKDHGFGKYHVVLMSTSNGGKTWKQLLDTTQNPSGLPTNGPKRFYFTSLQNGWMTGPEDGTLNVRLYETHNGGKTWILSSIPPVTDSPSDENSFTESYGPFFSKARQGTLMVKSGAFGSNSSALTVFHTSDGGKSWKSGATIMSSGTRIFYWITFVNASNGWVLGTNEKNWPILQRTFDGGRHWKTLQPTGLQPYGEVITSMTFLNPTLGWMVDKTDDGTETLFQTYDGGRSWRALKPTLQ
ncbi:WD40/YVTN/BNR-like repeat-containing protein [Ktedonospora formicarum]|uniref:Photosynthesis system II assembly factor Ycf48/Hcf136-like domain-containing protein n=1 Tax=Ktedonospora formicarum TaxID=2778364 RepID=A0A8J3MUF1_9CHLR|nr:hypothetical protein [Ktedonospora formicarum]GHO46856.1 hypothetical protein KSX_50190 [Ktedonospora formicarum]